MPDAHVKEARFSFFKGGEDVVTPKGGDDFDWERVRYVFARTCMTH